MKNDPKEVREALKEILADDASAKTRRAIRDAIETISTMQADLRRLGMKEYDDEA